MVSWTFSEEKTSVQKHEARKQQQKLQNASYTTHITDVLPTYSGSSYFVQILLPSLFLRFIFSGTSVTGAAAFCLTVLPFLDLRCDLWKQSKLPIINDLRWLRLLYEGLVHRSHRLSFLLFVLTSLCLLFSLWVLDVSWVLLSWELLAPNAHDSLSVQNNKRRLLDPLRKIVREIIALNKVDSRNIT